MDSDSDNDILTNNVFTFQNRNMTVCAKGPNMTNTTGISFPNKDLSSTMQMPRNMDHSRYAGSVYEQRSIYCRREVSPMSVRSAYNFQPRNFNMSHYPRGMSSQRSLMNGRSGSPMSMTSTATVSAIDIAMAFKNDQFNKHDLKIISEAYHKYVKRKIRKKYEKRRNLRLFLKGARRRSGGESGEQGSDSSISDDDCQSNKTSLFKENMSSCRSTRTDFTDIRRTMQESNMFNDCSANFKQKSFKNAFSIDSSSLNTNVSIKPQNTSLLKDRFKSGFLLPSQRFNKSVAASAIPENVEKAQKNKIQQPLKQHLHTAYNRPKNFMSTDSEQEEIFSNTNNTVVHKEVAKETQPKRNLEKDDETHTPHKKRCKLPIKKVTDENINNNNEINKSNEKFIFAKPSIPIKKLSNLKVKEKIISKSPHVNNVLARNDKVTQNQVPNVQHTETNKEEELSQSKECHETTQLNSTDVSMRPSFIKRKLFTQKLDVAETKNINSDVDSPKAVYNGMQKEKHKARKLVTNQSCLSRDVLQEDNLLDLIHKIVPAEKINSTNQINRSDTQRKSKDVEDNWDITSIISNINNDDVSDTYTDEDIFNNTFAKNNNKEKKNASKKGKNKQECGVVIERMVTPANNRQKDTRTKNNPKGKGNKENENIQKPTITTNPNQNNIKTCIKSFWDTDIESDLENHETIRRINTPIHSQKIGINKRVVDQQTKKMETKKTAPVAVNNSILNSTTASVQKFNKTTLGIRSHRVPKKKKCCDEQNQTITTSYPAQSKEDLLAKNNTISSYSSAVHNVKSNNKPPVVPENKSKNGRVIRSCRTPKQIPKEIPQNQNKKTNKKTEVNRTLRPRKSDLSNSSLNDSVITRSQAKRNKKS